MFRAKHGRADAIIQAKRAGIRLGVFAANSAEKNPFAYGNRRSAQLNQRHLQLSYYDL